MKTYEQFYINGEWVDPVEELNTCEVLNPANEEVIGKDCNGKCSRCRQSCDSC